ncbi:Cell wall transcription factor ACE2 [Lecanosticta acicola]|uniref:Cell wall transcription factor ACE2 n=1 Tax=Lecanosticta acicola TaxID=111012 RepID=A0AAI8Z0R9_9PEZI|nr:Cell wall transcription factor ACE2 [Lecanosticta acicola]
MSFFPTADPEKLRAAMAQNQAYYQTPTTPSSYFEEPKPTSDSEPHGYWSTPGASGPASFSGPQAIPWASQYPHGLRLGHVPTPTQSTFDTAQSTASSHPPSTAWAPGPMPLAPASVYPDLTTQSAGMDFCYSMATPTMATSASWEPVPTATSIYPSTYEASPERSEYSTSSQQSLVSSSPYAQSDDYLQTHPSPYIKVEESSDSIRPRLYSIPGLMPSAQPSHVNPGDIFAGPPLSVLEHQGMPPFEPPTKVEQHGEIKPHSRRPQRSQRPQNRRAISEDTISIAEGREKRGYTTHANSTCHCEHCGKLFQRSYNLKAHLETHDPGREQPHACSHPGCRRRFVRRTDLTRHEQSVHLKERKYQCPLCCSSFARKDTLRRHTDDGCPRRPEVKRRYERVRSGSISRDQEPVGSANPPTTREHSR